ncbi:hypothetical protein BJV82DRAFT_654991 [Fennellomyces sp. T-0311]|nr:hypothetical protein BJV82DRAFT_654991 [Fennellomyces sp. T-0311]
MKRGDHGLPWLLTFFFGSLKGCSLFSFSFPFCLLFTSPFSPINHSSHSNLSTYLRIAMTTADLQFNQGIMKVSSFDPQSRRMETRVLCLPDLPRLESLEHLFTAGQMETEAAPASSLRLTKSFTGKKSASRVPRRCYSNPALSRKKETSKAYLHVAHDVTGESYKGCRRSPSRRSLSHALHAFTGLLQKAKRSSTLRSKQQWHNETWLVEMRLSDDAERPSKKKRVGAHAENWWSASPPVCAY